MTLPLPDPLIVTPRGRIGDDVADPWGVQRNLEAIAAAFPVHAANLAGDVLLLAVAGTSRKVAFGTASLSFAASSFASTVVAHGLGVTPVVSLSTPDLTTGGLVTTYIQSPGATNITIAASAVPTANYTQTTTVYWLAIG